MFLINIPTKFYEYMAKGLPIIASDFKIYKDFLNKNARTARSQDPGSARTAPEQKRGGVENRGWVEFPESGKSEITRTDLPPPRNSRLSQ